VSLSKELVQHIAVLSRLQLEEDDFDGVVAKLSSIVDFFDQLQQVPTDNVEPMAHPLHQVQRLHPDVVTEANERDVIQTNASIVQDGFYLVPKVIE
jgi:aspartyl-tRNA(Asn)/glutamyl-tRNA(Gln) amidotransferase subunit C